ncbi:hypothetical protein [Methanoplanus limicola]|nr:hypothetical protein [Methanoplanus limicola]
MHDNEKLGIGLTKVILKQVKLSREDYEEVRRNI